jgi:NADH-quinone oxidoreductase subunit L
MALGAGAYTTAIFHVMTHAFFKACLFLGSGSVIHAMEHTDTVKDPQDIRTMGGLLKYMKVTGWTFWISTLAIAGIPMLSGFFSKDEILGNVFFSGFHESTVYFFVWGVGVVTACLTAFYMTRVTFLTFNGQERFPEKAHKAAAPHDAHHADAHGAHGHDAHHDHKPHESGIAMTFPLMVLAFLAVVGGYLGFNEFIGHSLGMHEPHILNSHWLGKIIANRDLSHVMHEHQAFEMGLIALAIAISVGVVAWTYNFYKKYDLAGDDKVKAFFGPMYKVMENKFYVDEFYQFILLKPFVWIGENVIMPFDKNVIDGAVNGTGSAMAKLGEGIRKMQTGNVSNYAMIVSIGVVTLLAYLIFG